MAILSGSSWVKKFPTSVSTKDLIEPFRSNTDRFIRALRAGGATVQISATLRPPERAYLMHYAWQIARNKLNANAVPQRAGVNIDWVHRTIRTTSGADDATASRRAAQQMIDSYQIVSQPALDSNHIRGLAIDMTISWTGELKIKNAAGQLVKITNVPRSGGNTSLHKIGLTYGLRKLVSDPPHWSYDGH